MAFIFAHRGFSHEFPENTTIAFEEALDLGVDGCECDVHLSSDGVPYLMHDDSFHRTTGIEKGASELTYEEISGLDAGSWKDESLGNEPPPRFDDILRMHVQGGAVLLTELKPHGDGTAMAEAVLETIAAENAHGHVILQSFDADRITLCAERAPRIPCLLLLSSIPREEDEQRWLIAQVLSRRLQGIALHHGAADPEFVRRARMQQLSVTLWTINDEGDLDRALAKEIDAVISDRPDMVRRQLLLRG